MSQEYDREYEGLLEGFRLKQEAFDRIENSKLNKIFIPWALDVYEDFWIHEEGKYNANVVRDAAESEIYAPAPEPTSGSVWGNVAAKGRWMGIIYAPPVTPDNLMVPAHRPARHGETILQYVGVLHPLYDPKPHQQWEELQEELLERWKIKVYSKPIRKRR